MRALELFKECWLDLREECDFEDDEFESMNEACVLCGEVLFSDVAGWLNGRDNPTARGEREAHAQLHVTGERPGGRLEVVGRDEHGSIYRPCL